MSETATKTEFVPQHQWVDDSGRVLLVRCADQDGKSYGGFHNPDSGPVRPLACSREPTCGSGGLFGWPWGINLGGGKAPDYLGRWYVVAARPEQVVYVTEDGGGKCKIAADRPEDVDAEVVYSGTWAGAMEYTRKDRVAWILHASQHQDASATGERGSASATGARGSASATGWSGSASATGWSGSASATGERGSASATGWSGSASATGWSGSASATGARGSASATGWSGSASATGERGSASATGARGSASATGWSGSASATGERGSASATGWSGSASATGERGSAVIAGECGTVEVGAEGLGAVTANEWYWRVRPGAVVACRWNAPDGSWPARLLVADDLGLKDGDLVHVVAGELVG